MHGRREIKEKEKKIAPVRACRMVRFTLKVMAGINTTRVHREHGRHFWKPVFTAVDTGFMTTGLQKSRPCSRPVGMAREHG